jgi:hypothetical protein
VTRRRRDDPAWWPFLAGAVLALGLALTGLVISIRLWLAWSP